MFTFTQKSLSMAFVLLALGCANLTAAAERPQAAQSAADPVAFSFIFFGCNRLDGDGVDATQIKSTANEAQLLQDFQDIAALPQAPQYVFLAGDIVKGMKPDLKVLQKQLPAWISLVTDAKNNPLIAKKIPMVAFTGNHELLKKEDCVNRECPNPLAYAYWPDIMLNNPANYSFISGNNGPGKAGADGLQDDESRLSYSFQSGGNFFLILNTDSLINDQSIGVIPINWAKAQLQAAQKDTQVKNIFVMGHKPLYPTDSSGDRSILPDQGAALYAAMNDPAGDHTPSKVRGYLAAHAHEWNYLPQLPIANVSSAIPQVVAGNGGSPPNENWKGGNAYFGYTLVEISQGGAVTAKSFGRPIPDPYYTQQAKPATQQGEVYTLYAPLK